MPFLTPNQQRQSTEGNTYLSRKSSQIIRYTDASQTKPVFPLWLSAEGHCKLVKKFSDLVHPSCLYSIHKIVAQNAGPQFTNCCGLDFVTVYKNKLLQHEPIISQCNDVERVDVHVYLLHDLLNLQWDSLSRHHLCNKQNKYVNDINNNNNNAVCRMNYNTHVFKDLLWRCWLGGRKGIWPVKNWVVGCWHGYLSGVWCRLAYGPADATVTHCLLLQ